MAYATPAQLTLPILLKWALVFEEPVNRTLRIAPATPREWLAPTSIGLSWNNVPTRYGRVSASLRPLSPLVVAVNLTIVARAVAAEEPFKPPPGGIQLSVRLPLATPRREIKAVTVGGKPWAALDPSGEGIVFSAARLGSSAFRDGLSNILVTFGAE